VKGFAVPFTIADLRTPGKLFEYISLSQWPTFSLQNTHMRAELVMNAIQTLSFEVAEPIWHSDQGKQYGAAKTRELLLRKGFVLSMSRAGTPTDNGYAERFVGSFKLAVADRRPYHTLGQFLRAAEAWINFYNQERPHEGLENLSPLQYAQQQNLQDIPYLTL
jgi:putative transposase